MEYYRVSEMINRTIGVSLIALTLVVSLFTASSTTNAYADNDKEYKKKKAKGLRVIIDLIKEDYYDYYYDSDYRHHSKYDRHHHYYDDGDYKRNLYKVTVGTGTCYDVWPGYGYAVSKTYRLDYDKQVLEDMKRNRWLFPGTSSQCGAQYKSDWTLNTVIM
jgi:hypothetical protein